MTTPHDRAFGTPSTVAMSADQSRWLGIACVAIASILAIVGAWQLSRTWQHLPGAALATVNWEAISRQPFPSAGPAGEAWVLAYMSSQVHLAWRRPDNSAKAFSDARSALRQLDRTDVGRLHVALLTCMHLERSGVPREDWWPRVRDYLALSDGARLSHFLPELMEARAGVYVRHGVPEGAARQLSREHFGGLHNAFLQRVVPFLDELAAARAAAGDDDAAAQCRAARRRLLRAWIVEPGPAGLRLLAADLLAQDEQIGPALRTKLREWRGAYRSAMRDLPIPPALLRAGNEVTPQVVARSESLAIGLALSLHLGLSCGVLIAIAAVTSPLWIRHRVLSVPMIAVAVMCIAAATVWPTALYSAVRDDLTRVAQEDAGRMILPPIALITTFLIVAIATLPSVMRNFGVIVWLRIQGAACGGAAVVLAVVFLLSSLTTSRMADRLDTALDVSIDEQMRQIADPDAGGLIDALRSWDPAAAVSAVAPGLWHAAPARVVGQHQWRRPASPLSLQSCDPYSAHHSAADLNSRTGFSP